MILAQHTARLVLREWRRTLAALVGVSIASALITSVLLFGAASGTTVTRRALADLPVDAQVVLGPGSDPAVVDEIVRADPAVRTISAFDLAHFDSAEAVKAGTATQTSAGILVGIDPSYTPTTGLFPVLTGQVATGQVAISRDLASNLGVVPGDSIAVALAGGSSVSLVVSGVVSIDGADLVLGPIDAAHRAAGANPPTNVALMRRADLESMVLPRIPAGAVAADPATAGQTPGGPSPVLAADPAVRRELHVQLDHAQLPGDPVAAGTWLDTIRHRVEKVGGGAFQWVDDAGASLEPLASDLAWGQILFVFLALPGILLALALSRLAADATADSTRRHAALLRARGASTARLARIFLGATVLTSVIGALVGVAAGVAIGVGFFPSELVAAGFVEATVRSVVAAVVLTTALASLAAAALLRDQLLGEVAPGRQAVQRVRPAVWQRLYLDLVLLIAGMVVYGVAGGGIHPVLTAEGNPTVTLALTSFVAPLLLWSGGTMLLLRLVSRRMTGRWARMAAALQSRFGPGGMLAGLALTARAAAASRAIVVLALAVGFATSVVIFNATYRQQQRVDAQLILGADLKAVPAAPATVADIAQLQGPGVVGVTPFVHRVVYVGPEAQDLLAIDPTTLPAVAPLSNAFFKGQSAAAAMDALHARPDAILVSAETATDYSIVPGDQLRIRIPDANGTLQTVAFTMAGIALEFPTAPRDAFLVANLGYVADQTGNDAISFALARSGGDDTAIAADVGRRLGPGWEVTDLASTTARLANGITSVDLSALAALDVGFAMLIATVGLVLFLLAGLADRRRELATLVAIGAEPRQMRSAIAAEALVIAVAGTAIGLLTGAGVGASLLQILAGVFDPPADSPVIPFGSIAAIVGAIAASVGVAVASADRGLTRLNVVGALRER